MAGVWDTSTPAGSEAISNGDNRLREAKVAIENALLAQGSSGVEAVFPGSAPTTAPIYRPRFLKGTTAARPAASADQGIYVNETLNTIQRCSTAPAWVDIATLIPSGTVMVFYQANAPTGWTKITTQNDKALRVTSGSGGSAGGTNAFSTLGSGSSTDVEGAHTHAVSGTTGGASTAGTGNLYQPGTDAHNHTFSVTSGAGSNHAHALTSLAPAYVDVILASKD